jgi:ESS family glutamate:Na+ symporter
MTNAVLIAAGFLIAGVFIRAKVKWLASLYIPAAMVAGLIALLASQLAGAATMTRQHPLVITTIAEWESWRGVLVPIIFAALLLVKPDQSSPGQLRETVRQGIAAWVLILGQLAVGLLVTAVVLAPAFDVPIHFGQLLEVSWAGGFASSSGWGQVHQARGGYPQAGELATFFTTIGLLYGVLSGVLLVNIGIRRRWNSNPPATLSNTGMPPGSDSQASINRPTAGGAIDALTLQILLIAAAFGVGVLLRAAVGWMVAALPASSSIRSIGGDLPLFVFTLLGGWLVRRFLQLLNRDDLIDNEAIHRLSGVALDLLVFVAIATLKLQVIKHNWMPATLLMLCGAAWVWLYVVFLARRLLPHRCWFELAVMNHGFATATTAQGMMLLRMIDPDLRTDAARIYAQAAPLTAMFIGGGLITYMLPEILASTPPMVVFGACLVAAAVMFIVGWRLGAISPPRVTNHAA